jgi:hypothetical protein
VKEEHAIDKQLSRGIFWGFVIVLCMAIVSPLIYGQSGDTFGFFRTIFETTGPILLKGSLGLVLLYILEYGLSGCWIRRIYDALYGPAIIFAVFLYCVLR